MPIYEYRCNQCGEISEILITTSFENENPRCTNCGSNDLNKVMSVSSFTFSDSGRVPGTTCCGREVRCETPPCSTDSGCRRG